MAAPGSIPEWQEFSRRGAKPTCRFRDCDAPPLMTGDGWLGEWRLWLNFGRIRPFTGLNSPQRQHAFVPRYLRHAHADEEGAFAKWIAMLQDALQQRVGNDRLILQQLDLGKMQVPDHVRIDVAEGRIHL